MPSATSAWGRSMSRRFLQISGGLLGGKDRYDGDDVRLLPPRWRPHQGALTHPVPPSTPQPHPSSSTPTTTPCSRAAANIAISVHGHSGLGGRAGGLSTCNLSPAARMFEVPGVQEKRRTERILPNKTTEMMILLVSTLLLNTDRTETE
jgi:hypothetical protein